MHPADFAHWSETGTFADGTVIVKELVTVGAKNAVSGNGYFMGDFVGLEATVKDRTRFADEPGNWAYFSFGHAYPLAASAPAQPATVCNACHAANGTADFVFTRYYPVLRAAKPGSDGAIAAPAPAAPGSEADASLRAGSAAHPQGSAIMKEFHDDDGGLIGWAVAATSC